MWQIKVAGGTRYTGHVVTDTNYLPLPCFMHICSNRSYVNWDWFSGGETMIAANINFGQQIGKIGSETHKKMEL
jgi:hypothetical protein